MNPLRQLNGWMLHWQVAQALDVDARAERAARQRGMRRKNLPWIACLVLAALGLALVPKRPGVDWWHVALTLALLPPFVALAWLRIRELLAGDELEQRIELLAMGIAFIIALTVLLFFSLLDAFDAAVRIKPLWICYLLLLGYQLIVRLVRARYR